MNRRWSVFQGYVRGYLAKILIDGCARCLAAAGAAGCIISLLMVSQKVNFCQFRGAKRREISLLFPRFLTTFEMTKQRFSDFLQSCHFSMGADEEQERAIRHGRIGLSGEERFNNPPALLFSPESCLLMLHPVFHFFHFENRNVTTKRKPHSGPPSGFSA